MSNTILKIGDIHEKNLANLVLFVLASGLLLTACAKSGNSSHSSSTSSKLTASEQKLLKQATSDYKTSWKAKSISF